MKAEGFEQESLERISKTDFTKHAAFHIGDKPLQIEFLTKISGLTFDEAYSARDAVSFEDKILPVINLEHLIISKLSSRRPKDKHDVEELQRLLRQQDPIHNNPSIFKRFKRYLYKNLFNKFS